MSMRIVDVLLPSAHFNGESTLPSLYEMSNVQALTESRLDEDDGLFVGYGRLRSVFPYRMQDLYDRAEEPTVYLGVELENRYLKALFLPALGGRLWSLYDKAAGKELLYRNPVIRPCNLAVRNAWLAGGIEFNCGMIGHHPLTCSQLFAAQTELDDGTPVLRMYEFERIRQCVYQMDFFLPEDSRVLLGRMRIVNPTRVTVPMYWWTNMAVRENPRARDIIDATVSYNNKNGIVGKNPVPFSDGIDITYPSNNPVAIDYFWKIPESARKFTAYLDENGYGFCQTSTARLQGRKLFVWGQGEGGARWQEFLTSGEPGRYVEIQAGLAHTQYECLPMPPLTAWEWMEAYGALSADPVRVHGDWDDARSEVRMRLESLCSESGLQTMLEKTRGMAKRPAEKMICSGSGWGALERMRRAHDGEHPMCPHLDFGQVVSEQADWVRLLEQGTLESDNKFSAPVSWMLQDEWTERIKKSAECHEKYLHLSAIALAEGRLRDAGEAIAAALAIRTTPTALFLRAQVERLNGDEKAAANSALEALRLSPADVSLARQALMLAVHAGLNDQAAAAYEAASAAVRADGRAAMTYAFALLHSGKTEEAESILMRDGGLVVTDIREGEISLTNLYLSIRRARAEAFGLSFDPAEENVPRRFDFRMSVPKKKPQ